MRFRRGARLDPSQVTDLRGRSRGRARGGLVLGGGGLGGGALLLYLLFAVLTGGGLGELEPLDGRAIGTDSPGQVSEACRRGEDANERQDCRIVAVVNSVQAYWDGVFERSGRRYPYADTVFFTDEVQTGCGYASSQVGPFYCPRDELVYIDLGFFDELRSRFGAGGDFAQAYVIAHEYGHHVQNQTGVLERIGGDRQGPESRAVRAELQADCYAGAWAADAVRDQRLFEELTQRDIDEALDAASAIGDDRIQERARGQVNPETWTHGSAEQRRRWFSRGYERGTPAACDTFSGGI
ncbi:MAG: neutral zinc metallopeptidase [Thermoleophilia bacterium]|nr:neutral zinc metallopeptidase [Thermoleophilia bacterium]